MKTLLKISLLLIGLGAGAQDTIYFKNSSAIAAKISEVGISEITYKRFDNPEGPSYVSSKDGVAKIKYANGVTDTIVYVSPKMTLTTKDTLSHRNELRLAGTELYYDNVVLGQIRLHYLLKHKTLSKSQVAAIKEAAGIKRKKQGYNALGTGLFVTGFAVPAAVTMGVLFDDKAYANKNAVNEVVVGAITGALFRIAGHVIVKINKNKSRTRQKAFIQKYSQYEAIN